MRLTTFPLLAAGSLAAFLFALLLPADAAEPEAHKALARIRAVGPEGAGNAEASDAWKQVVGGGVDMLIPALAALDGAGPAAANWLRTAVDAIAGRERAARRPLPAAKLEAFVRDTKHSPLGRRLAYELLVEADPKAPARLLPQMIDDPSVELRRDAIAVAIDKATPLVKSDPKAAAGAFRKLFDASRDPDQIESTRKTLKTLGVEADVAGHYGFVTRWMLAGPFEGAGGTGFDKAFPPETKVDLAAKYAGKAGKEIAWQKHETKDAHGVVDLNKALGKHKHAVAYAFAAFESDAQRPVEVRLGSTNGVKVFLNGKQIYGLEEYHHGQRIDQYVGRGTLKKGRNELLLKVVQNDQSEDWAQGWSFQVRLCDATGGAVPIKMLTGE